MVVLGLNTWMDADKGLWMLWPEILMGSGAWLSSRIGWTARWRTMWNVMTDNQMHLSKITLKDVEMIMEFLFYPNLRYLLDTVNLRRALQHDQYMALLVTSPHSHLRTRRMAQGTPKGTMRWETVMAAARMDSSTEMTRWTWLILMMKYYVLLHS